MSNTKPLKGHDPDCLHCAICLTAKDFLNSHPAKSNGDMAAEVLQFAAQFVVCSTQLSPEEAVVKLTQEMRNAALEWLARNPEWTHRP